MRHNAIGVQLLIALQALLLWAALQCRPFSFQNTFKSCHVWPSAALTLHGAVQAHQALHLSLIDVQTLRSRQAWQGL